MPALQSPPPSLARSLTRAAIGALLLATAACAGNVTPGQPLAGTSCMQKMAGETRDLTLTVIDPARSDAPAREVALTIFAPAQPGTYPLIAFSHGAFAAPARYRALLEPLAAAGHVVIAPMHIDSEELKRAQPPSQAETWETRNADMALALAPPVEARALLARHGITLDAQHRVAMGHSYGALIAQLAGGARAVLPGEPAGGRRVPSVDAVVGWSPPGPMEGYMESRGWSLIAVPNLTITGTADVLPGFVDDWRVHKVSYQSAPTGNRALWVGEGVDHYFGGLFGRQRPADTTARAMLERAQASTLGFIERALGNEQPCSPGAPIAGEAYVAD